MQTRPPCRQTWSDRRRFVACIYTSSELCDFRCKMRGFQTMLRNTTGVLIPSVKLQKCTEAAPAKFNWRRGGGWRDVGLFRVWPWLPTLNVMFCFLYLPNVQSWSWRTNEGYWGRGPKYWWERFCASTDRQFQFCFHSCSVVHLFHFKQVAKVLSWWSRTCVIWWNSFTQYSHMCVTTSKQQHLRDGTQRNCLGLGQYTFAVFIHVEGEGDTAWERSIWVQPHLDIDFLCIPSPFSRDSWFVPSFNWSSIISAPKQQWKQRWWPKTTPWTEVSPFVALSSCGQMSFIVCIPNRWTIDFTKQSCRKICGACRNTPKRQPNQTRPQEWNFCSVLLGSTVPEHSTAFWALCTHNCHPETRTLEVGLSYEFL